MRHADPKCMRQDQVPAQACIEHKFTYVCVYVCMYASELHDLQGIRMGSIHILT